MFKYVFFFCFSVALTLSLRNNSMFNYNIRTVTVFHIIGRKIRNVTEYHVFSIKIHFKCTILNIKIPLRYSHFDIWTVTVIHVNPYKPRFLSKGRRQTVETQIRHFRMWCLIRVSTVCLKIYPKLYKKGKNTTKHPVNLK